MDKDKFILDFIESPDKYYLDDDNRINIGSNPHIKLEDVVFYRIDRITYEDKAPRKEALENVLSAMRVKGVNFIFLIKGTKTGVSFYYGICRDLIQKIPLSYDMDELGEMILKPSIESNFRGSKISKQSDNEEQDIIDCLANMRHIGCIDGVPGINEDEENYQGIDRLVDVMLGDEFAFLVVSKALPYNSVRHFEKGIYSFYDRLVPLAKKSIQKGENHGKTTVDTTAKGKSMSDVEGKQSGETHNHGKAITDTRSSQTKVDDDETRTEGVNVQDHEKYKTYSTNSGSNESHTEGESETYTIGTNITEGITNTSSYDFSNKEAQDWLKYIDDVILKRIDYGKGKGMYISTIALFAMQEAVMDKLQNTVTSLFSGKTGNKVPLRKLSLTQNGQRGQNLRNFQVPVAYFTHDISENEVYTRTVLSQYVTDKRAYLGNWFSVNELSIIAGLPQKEIVGLSLREEVEFGLNYRNDIPEESKLPLGKLVQSGKEYDDIIVSLDKRELDKHIFIAGVTGSGKTTTCQKLLLSSKLPFLVIEPAKTEYRILTKKYDDILIFTLGKDKIAPFRLNPFEMYPHESVTSHVDMIMASIESAFDMEAAIPQIIEKSIYECYKDFGWDISDDTNKYYSWKDIESGAYAFPTLSDLIDKAEVVVKDQGFDARLQNDYIGSIKARLQGLTVGSKGLMLNTRRSLDFRNLVHRKVILELEEVRSGSEKALIMGFILSNMMEAIRAEYDKSKREKKEFKHITLVEEAHRLLGKYEPGDSLSKKQGIEIFSDMLAEVRKYGECLVIVDQIPGKLTPEVLKNTNTKIVHKIFAQDDKEAIGNTMALSDEQKGFLSLLDKGRAIVFSQGWESSLQVQIVPATDTGDKEIISEKVIRKSALEYYCEKYKMGIFPSIKYLDSKPDITELLKHISHKNNLAMLISGYQNVFFQTYKATEKEQKIILKLEEILTIEQQAKYIRDYLYFEDTNDVKLNAICLLLLKVKNGEFDLAEFDNKLSYGRRTKK